MSPSKSSRIAPASICAGADASLANYREVVHSERDPAGSALRLPLLARRRKELANLIERKTQTLRPLDEPEPVNRGYWIAVVTLPGGLWQANQTPGAGKYLTISTPTSGAGP